MTPDPGFVGLELRGQIAEVRLDRPQARNAINLAFARELDRVLSQVEADDEVQVVLLSASGPAFCAGQDLKALASGEEEAFLDGVGWGGITHRDRTKPLIAVVQGPALAGGFEIVLAADLVVASPQATFGLPEIHHGLLAAAGGAARLPLRIAPVVAAEMLLCGDPIDAERAAALGLVNAIVELDELGPYAERLAARIAAQPVAATQATLRVAKRARAEGEAAAQALALQLLAELHALR
jgi:enoyl-CoA hydratase